jgi:hypothetical protein
MDRILHYIYTNGGGGERKLLSYNEKKRTIRF